ncbi:glutamate-5-semialdehyde dehydrogenase [Thermomonas aquatica]|uniref:Gamma-glutamyl phosphate reductase n=1 Tax=Thermomonas aquatica TaxID=2202149 RepID=A0A5B7ZMR4_9GAMM|nr:glutamate-5-semialdehyde dehydrogenase [Thermomonas aquatica]QDA56278.1 glutamate-5-semialdehyde dehydrogenase [Thermomonas aquatica]
MSYVRGLAVAARDAQAAIASADGATRRRLLQSMAEQLRAGQAAILAANADDLAQAAANGASKATLDRLGLDPERVQGMAEALREVAAQADPLGEVTRREVRPNGIVVERQRIPLGLVAMIYEARPNVTAEAAALCLKAGNAVLLRGGSEAARSNAAIAACLHAALRELGLPEAAVSLVADTAREHVLELLQLADLIDLAIPRGGESLIRFVAEHARVPVIKHYKGVCHLYVDRAAGIDTAIGLLIDGKASRPGVCNALETVLVHRDIAAAFLPRALAELHARGVEVRGDAVTRAFDAGALAATEDDYAAEFLDLVIAARVVDSLDEAIAHIRRHGSDHTEVIATEDPAAADAFVRAIRSSAVMVNASSRFNDGGQLGLGAEIGISTTRLHAYGPMGVESLTIERFVVRGTGQVRHPR